MRVCRTEVRMARTRHSRCWRMCLYYSWVAGFRKGRVGNLGNLGEPAHKCIRAVKLRIPNVNKIVRLLPLRGAEAEFLETGKRDWPTARNRDPIGINTTSATLGHDK